MRRLVKTVLGHDLGVISRVLDLHIFWSRATSDQRPFCALFRNFVGNLSCRTPWRMRMKFDR
jgi:hypothetical protein